MTDFDEILEKMETTGDHYAEAKRQSWLLQELKGVILSQSIKNVLDSENGISFQKAENEAKSSKTYMVHLEGTSVAIENELKAKCRYEKVCAEFEAKRSLISLEKRVMKG